jgi:hypothetical protein
MLSEAIIVALIGLVGAVMVSLIQRHRVESNESNTVMANSLDRIEKKLDNHIDDHLKGDV